MGHGAEGTPSPRRLHGPGQPYRLVDVRVRVPCGPQSLDCYGAGGLELGEELGDMVELIRLDASCCLGSGMHRGSVVG